MNAWAVFYNRPRQNFDGKFHIINKVLQRVWSHNSEMDKNPWDWRGQRPIY